MLSARRFNIWVVLLLLFALILPVNASSTEHISGLDDDFDGTGEIQVNSFLGEFDSTMPGEPPMDEWWINIAIPTATIFYSNQNGNPEQLESPSYTITNYSYMGIYIHVEDFVVVDNVGLHLIDTLFVSGDNDIPVILAGSVATPTDPLQLFALDGNSGVNDVGVFEYVGYAPTVGTLTDIYRPEFNLVLRFEVADVSYFTPTMLIAMSTMHLEDLLLSGMPSLNYFLIHRLATDNHDANVVVDGILDSTTALPQPENPESEQPGDSDDTSETAQRPPVQDNSGQGRPDLPQAGFAGGVNTLTICFVLLLPASVMILLNKRANQE